MALVHINKNNFKEEVENYTGKVLLDFWAPGCSPCRMIGPSLEELAEEQDKVKICKVNVDEENTLAAMFSVTSIPLLVLMENGKVIKSSVGYLPKEEIEEFIK